MEVCLVHFSVYLLWLGSHETFPVLMFRVNGVYFDKRFPNYVYYWFKVFVVSLGVGFMKFYNYLIVHECGIPARAACSRNFSVIRRRAKVLCLQRYYTSHHAILKCRL